jgi:hypothetical protein
MSVRTASRIEPPVGERTRVAGTVEQAVDQVAALVRVLVGEERLDLGEVRRAAGDLQVGAAHEAGVVEQFGGLLPEALQSPLQQLVDVRGCGARLAERHPLVDRPGRLLRRAEGAQAGVRQHLQPGSQHGTPARSPAGKGRPVTCIIGSGPQHGCHFSDSAGDSPARRPAIVHAAPRCGDPMWRSCGVGIRAAGVERPHPEP